MSNKKSILEAPKNLVFKALDKTKSTFANANGYALNTTEEVVNEGIILAEQWQTVTNTAIKGGLALAATQQDIVFNTLTGMKKHIILSKKRFIKLVA
jgi:predicted oxidoreductase